MSTPEEPEPRQLTRRQLREMRDTASNPVITPEEAAAAKEATVPVVAPLPRPAEPVVVEEAPAAAEVDLAAPALTRRSARRQERLRTASVPVHDGDDAAHEHDGDGAATPRAVTDATAEDAAAVEAPEAPSPVVDADEETTTTAAAGEVSAAEGAAEQAADGLAAAQSEAPDVETPSAQEALVEVAGETVVDETAQERPRVAPTFGSGLLAGEGVEIELPASFDQLLNRGSAATGAIAASNALILSQTPETGSLSSPVTATGEVLITGTFALPESLGSAGTTSGSSDGKEIDAILLDGELPASSSPTPIAASAAISTIKSADDIIKPPAPEKGGRLMLVLVITAGALALALTGALVVALVTGVFR